MGCRQSTASWVFKISGWYGSRRSPPSLMDSAPIAIPMSMLPSAIWFAMSCVALSPEEQNLFTEDAPEVLGMPAAREAARTMYAAFPLLTCKNVSVIFHRVPGTFNHTLPRQTSSIRLGSSLDFSTTFFNNE